MKGHNFKGRVAGKQYCTNCGLVALNNDFTRWCIAKGCEHEDNPGFKKWLTHWKPKKKLSKEWSDWLDQKIEAADKRNGFK